MGHVYGVVIFIIVSMVIIINLSVVARAFDWEMSDKVLMLFAGQIFVIFLMVLVLAIAKYLLSQAWGF